jgi:threonine/homoserine/homoserine lactone efflux protein
MIVEPHLFQLYLIAAVVLILIPGPDSLLVLSRSLFDGRRAGWITAAGTTMGNVAHATLAAAGISAVIAASPELFYTLRLAGAGYLAWLGLRSLRVAWQAWRSGSDRPLLSLAPASARRAFSHAFLTNLLNPKVVLFYLAFVPQFVSPGAGSIALQTLLLGLILAFLAWLYHLALAALAAGAAQRVMNSRGFRAAIDGMAGLLFIGFAARLFLTERRFA